MSLRGTALTAVAGALALGTLALCTLALVALNTGGEAPFMKLAAGYDRKAEPLLAGPGAPLAEARQEAAALSRRALAQFPYDTSDWLRLAYVDALEHKGLTPKGVALLRRSYDLVGVDPYVGVWRIRFALENSQAIPRDVRTAARNEATALWQIGKYQNELRQMVGTIHNPAGRLSAALWLNRLESSVAQ